MFWPPDLHHLWQFAYTDPGEPALFFHSFASRCLPSAVCLTLIDKVSPSWSLSWRAAGVRTSEPRGLPLCLPLLRVESRKEEAESGRTAETSRMDGLRRRLRERQIERRGRISSPQPVTGRRGWRGPSTTAGPPERPPFRIVVKYWDCFEGKQQKVCGSRTVCLSER